eukprot:3071735-Amphidinium_carterae.1
MRPSGISGSQTVLTRDIAMGPDGSIYVTGYRGPGRSSELQDSSEDTFLLKYDVRGEWVWSLSLQDVLHSLPLNEPLRLKLVQESNLVRIAGVSEAVPSSGSELSTEHKIFIIDISHNGTVEIVRYCQDGVDEIIGFDLDSSGNLHAAGRRNGAVKIIQLDFHTCWSNTARSSDT